MRHAPVRVTVIDDSAELLAVFGDALRDEGVEVSLLDRAASLHEIEALAPDLIVIDLKLGTDSLPGWDIARLIRAHRQLCRLPIIVCSAALDHIRSHEDEIRQDPRTHLLPKPFSLDDLNSVLSQALDMPQR
ncbi:MAG: response regulator [Chloroflexi bacterium]|nr:response regulator [Chloroflexota bacterium]